MARKTQTGDWYFVCNCGTKFVHKEDSVECPRCGEQLQSREQSDPPWNPTLMRVADVARMLSISASKTYELIEKGRLEHHRIDGAIRVSDQQLRKYLVATKKGQSPPEWPPRSNPRLKLKHVHLK